MVVAAINVNSEIGKIAEVVDGILKRRQERNARQWEDVQDDVEAIGEVVTRYADVYRMLLLDLQWYAADPELLEEDRRFLERQVQEFLTDDRMLNRLAELRGSLQEASHMKEVGPSKNRDVGTAMRSLEQTVSEFMEFFGLIRKGEELYDSGGARLWHLGDVRSLLNGNLSDISMRDLTEESLRNRRPDRSLAIHSLVGQVRRGIGLHLLR